MFNGLFLLESLVFKKKFSNYNTSLEICSYICDKKFLRITHENFFLSSRFINCLNWIDLRFFFRKI